MTISYSAPAKIILSGEHASVYGKPTLISSLNLRLTVTIIQMMVTKPDKNVKMISDIVLQYLRKNKIQHKVYNYDLIISSEIPIGSNLGSSAALCVASVAAFLEFYTGKKFEKAVINDLAYEVEKNFHGNPSGADNSTVCFGGVIFFRKEFDFLKSILKLPFSIPYDITRNLLIIDSGKSEETTKDMVANVAKQLESEREETQEVFNTIEDITKQMVTSIVKNDLPTFRLSIIRNQEELKKLNVVSLSTIMLLESLKKFGVGKVTGAGGVNKGSGNLLFFADDLDKTKEYLKKKKIIFYSFIPDSKGLKRL